MSHAWAKPNPESDRAALHGDRQADWPEVWRHGRLLVPLAALVCLLIALGGVALVFHGVLGGGLLIAWTFTSLALICTTFVRPLHGRVRVSTEEGALVFPHSRAVLVLTFVGIPGFLVLIVAGCAALGPRWGISASVAATGGAMVVALLIVWLVLVGREQSNDPRRGWPAVRLSPEGLHIRGLFSSVFEPWSYDLHVVPETYGVGRLEPAPTSAAIARTIATDPAIVASAIHFYAEHKSARAELGTPAAEERVRSGDLRTRPLQGF